MTLPSVLPAVGLEGITLKVGSHSTRGIASVCAMEAVAWLAGEPHSDQPQCACPVIGAFMRSWNDGITDDYLRTTLLRPLLPALIGTRSTKDIELKRSYLALDWLVRVHAPAFLSLRDDLKAHAVASQGLTALTNTATCKAAQPALAAAWDAARDAAGAAARAAAWDAARDAVGAAARDAAGAAARDAAEDAAGDAAWAAARDAAGDAAWAAARAAARDAARAAVGDAVEAAAWDAAWDAARDALAPTVARLQQSAADLVLKMVAVTE